MFSAAQVEKLRKSKGSVSPQMCERLQLFIWPVDSFGIYRPESTRHKLLSGANLLASYPKIGFQSVDGDLGKFSGSSKSAWRRVVRKIMQEILMKTENSINESPWWKHRSGDSRCDQTLIPRSVGDHLTAALQKVTWVNSPSQKGHKLAELPGIESFITPFYRVSYGEYPMFHQVCPNLSRHSPPLRTSPNHSWTEPNLGGKEERDK